MTQTPLPPFSAWSGPRRPKIVLLVEAFGENEEKWRKPLVGGSGRLAFELLIDAGFGPEASRDLAPLLHPKFEDAWINRREAFLEEAEIGITNVFNLRPVQNKIETLCSSKIEVKGTEAESWPALSRAQYLRPEYLLEVSRLFHELDESSPNLILACGNTAAWATLRATNISQIRGTVTSATWPIECKVLPTFHPAGVLRQWSWRPIVLADLMKARREGEFPEIRRPSRRILHSPTIEEWEAAARAVLEKPPAFLGCDTETALGMIDTISFATSPESGFSCQFRPHRYRRGANFITVYPIRDGVEVANYWTEAEERRFWTANKALLESSIPKVFQNGLYDLQYILKMGIAPQALFEDSMLLAHSLFPEMQKGLGFLASIYSNEASWKLMRRHGADSEKRDE
jgi:uracil-DNA glycosylase